MKAVTQGQLSPETTPKILSGSLTGSQSLLSASSAPNIVAAKDDAYGERSVSIVEHQNSGATPITLGYLKSGKGRRPTSRPALKMHMSA